MVADINSGVIFSLLPLNAIFTAISMYNVEHVNASNFAIFSQDLISICVFTLQSSFDIVNIAYNGFCMMCSLIWPSIFCYFGTHITDRLLLIALIMYESKWYYYPLELQKFVILVIARSQKPAYFTGLNLIRCTLEIFGKVNIKVNALHYMQAISSAHFSTT